jgi:drug/metabolite transporter (DMT)-like permease
MMSLKDEVCVNTSLKKVAHMLIGSGLLRYIETHTPNVQAIIYMMMACFWFALMAILVRYISQEVHPFVMLIFRNVSSLLLMLPWAYRFGFRNIRAVRPKLYAMRGVSAIIGMAILFYSLSIMRVTDTIALTFTTPLITTLMAILFLGERVGYHRWVALLIGFVGVVIIVRPGSDTFHIASLWMLGAAMCWSTSNILIKKMTQHDSHQVIVFIMISMMVVLSIPFAMLYWHPVTLKQIGWLFVLGFVANQAQLFMTYAYSKTDISIVQPFDFARLIFISVMAYFVFGEIISAPTLLGALIISVSSVYILYREKYVAASLRSKAQK